ncbi:MAG: hypothetical protein SFW66_00725 [Gammaproteobacteria bacterium]|nr:hypothetical protein [Gammaproteobacteria bacterium]
MKRIFIFIFIACLFSVQQANAGYYKGYSNGYYKGYSTGYYYKDDTYAYQAITWEDCPDPFCWPSPPEMSQARCCKVFGKIGAYHSI